ncbi:MAG: iron ABC transporter permease [Firmicutes bacterium]|nr:iron ABC transporter permease [Bacillota bacterium]
MLRARQGATVWLLAAVLTFALFLSLCIGAVRISPLQVFTSLTGGDGGDSGILLGIRLPRVLLAGLVGADLAVAGAVLQGVFMNPLADPYVLGVSSGASLGAVIVIAFNPQFTLGGLGALPLFAMVGALLTILVVQHLASVDGRASVTGLLLAGVAASAFLSAAISGVAYASGNRVHQVWLWLVGGFSNAGWDLVTMALPYSVAGLACSIVLARDLNAMVLGEETATHLGVNVNLVRNVLVWTASLLTAVSVASSGIIGFVGMVIPHICRMVGPDHRFLVPASALAGAAATVLADTAGRTILAPQEIPVGIITSLVGGPFFLYLLRQNQRTRRGNPGA